MKNQDALLVKIIDTMNEKGFKNADLAGALGLNPQAITSWKNGSVKSYRQYLPKIAAFLGVSVDYLLDNEQKEKPSQIGELTTDELEMIKLYRAASESKRDSIRNLLK